MYAKEKHFRNPLLKFLAQRNNIILVDINKDLKLSIQKLAEVLKKGKNLGDLPGRNRTMTGKIGDFKQTFAILSQNSTFRSSLSLFHRSYNLRAQITKFQVLRRVTADFNLILSS